MTSALDGRNVSQLEVTHKSALESERGKNRDTEGWSRDEL